jgi:hypothetical protein
VKVWLDDLRPAPRGWRRARTPEEAIQLLRKGRVDEISLDHDLGIFCGGREATGYDVLTWIETEVAHGRLKPPEVMRIHSANAGAYRRMELAIESIQRLVRRASTLSRPPKPPGSETGVLSRSRRRRPLGVDEIEDAWPTWRSSASRALQLDQSLAGGLH